MAPPQGRPSPGHFTRQAGHTADAKRKDSLAEPQVPCPGEAGREQRAVGAGDPAGGLAQDSRCGSPGRQDTPGHKHKPALSSERRLGQPGEKGEGGRDVPLLRSKGEWEGLRRDPRGAGEPEARPTAATLVLSELGHHPSSLWGYTSCKGAQGPSSGPGVPRRESTPSWGGRGGGQACIWSPAQPLPGWGWGWSQHPTALKEGRGSCPELHGLWKSRVRSDWSQELRGWSVTATSGS